MRLPQCTTVSNCYPSWPSMLLCQSLILLRLSQSLDAVGCFFFVSGLSPDLFPLLCFIANAKTHNCILYTFTSTISATLSSYCVFLSHQISLYRSLNVSKQSGSLSLPLSLTHVCMIHTCVLVSMHVYYYVHATVSVLETATVTVHASKSPSFRGHLI